MIWHSKRRCRHCRGGGMWIRQDGVLFICECVHRQSGHCPVRACIQMQIPVAGGA